MKTATNKPATAGQQDGIVRRLSNHIAMMAPHQKERLGGRLLIEARDEIKRLQEGRLTAEEFNALCHNLHESGCPMTPNQHEAECAKFRRELYGPKMNPLREKIEANWSPSPMDGDRIVDGVR